jgi:hypothetical protein
MKKKKMSSPFKVPQAFKPNKSLFTLKRGPKLGKKLPKN